MSFQRSRCIIRQIYCGNGKVPKDTRQKKYSRKGTQYECLKKGFGAGNWACLNKNLSPTSLKQIKYIGPVFETNFKKKRIYSTKSLVNKMKTLSAVQKRELLKAVCKRKSGGIDYRAVNSVILYLHSQKVGSLPSCRIVKE